MYWNFLLRRHVPEHDNAIDEKYIVSCHCWCLNEIEVARSMQYQFGVPHCYFLSQYPYFLYNCLVTINVSYGSDEGSAFDALQTLADLSLRMPTAETDGGKFLYADNFDFGDYRG